MGRGTAKRWRGRRHALLLFLALSRERPDEGAQGSADSENPSPNLTPRGEERCATPPRRAPGCGSISTASASDIDRGRPSSLVGAIALGRQLCRVPRGRGDLPPAPPPQSPASRSRRPPAPGRTAGAPAQPRLRIGPGELRMPLHSAIDRRRPGQPRQVAGLGQAHRLRQPLADQRPDRRTIGAGPPAPRTPGAPSRPRWTAPASRPPGRSPARSRPPRSLASPWRSPRHSAGACPTRARPSLIIAIHRRAKPRPRPRGRSGQPVKPDFPKDQTAARRPECAPALKLAGAPQRPTILANIPGTSRTNHEQLRAVRHARP